MDVVSRMRKVRTLELMKEHEEFSRRLGMKDASEFKGVDRTKRKNNKGVERYEVCSSRSGDESAGKRI